MCRPRLDVLLDQHRVVAERRPPPRAFAARDGLVPARPGRAPPASPCRPRRPARLHQDREARILTPGYDGHARGDRNVTGGVLATHLLHHLRGAGRPARRPRPARGPPRMPRASDRKAVAGVYRLGAGVAGRGNDRLDVEVALDPHRLASRRGRAEASASTSVCNGNGGNTQPGRRWRITRIAIPLAPVWRSGTFSNTAVTSGRTPYDGAGPSSFSLGRRGRPRASPIPRTRAGVDGGRSHRRPHSRAVE